MTVVEVQGKMQEVFLALQTVESNLHTQQDKLVIVNKQETACAGGVAEIKTNLKTCQNEPVVSLSMFADLSKKLGIVNGYWDQQKALRAGVQSEIKRLENERKLLQDSYNSLSEKLVKAENNVVYIQI
jgi:hypothetical protein